MMFYDWLQYQLKQLKAVKRKSITGREKKEAIKPFITKLKSNKKSKLVK